MYIAISPWYSAMNPQPSVWRNCFCWRHVQRMALCHIPCLPGTRFVSPKRCFYSFTEPAICTCPMAHTSTSVGFYIRIAWDFADPRDVPTIASTWRHMGAHPGWQSRIVEFIFISSNLFALFLLVRRRWLCLSLSLSLHKILHLRSPSLPVYGSTHRCISIFSFF